MTDKESSAYCSCIHTERDYLITHHLLADCWSLADVAHSGCLGNSLIYLLLGHMSSKTILCSHCHWLQSLTWNWRTFYAWELDTITDIITDTVVSDYAANGDLKLQITINLKRYLINPPLGQHWLKASNHCNFIMIQSLLKINWRVFHVCVVVVSVIGSRFESTLQEGKWGQ